MASSMPSILNWSVLCTRSVTDAEVQDPMGIARLTPAMPWKREPSSPPSTSMTVTTTSTETARIRQSWGIFVPEQGIVSWKYNFKNFYLSCVLFLVAHMTDNLSPSHMTPIIGVMTCWYSYMTHTYLFHRGVILTPSTIHDSILLSLSPYDSFLILYSDSY